MSTKSRFLALLAVLSLLLAPAAHAGVLDGISGAFDDNLGPGVGGAWTGSTTYDNGLVAPNHLFGTIDYAVMTSANFSTAFPAATYAPTSSVVYLYQVNNTGNFSVSAEIVGVNTSASGIGQFENTPGEVASSLFGFDTGNKAIWNFASPLIGTGESSTILAFSSPNIPMLGAAITVDGGTFGVSSVPTPSNTPIPEPTGLVLLMVGTLAAAVRPRRRI